MNIPKPVMLMILDGWGINPQKDGNAVALANTKNLDDLARRYPCTQLACSGESVGLPAGVMGNSEVGHLNIGAGRIVYQDLLRIDRAIDDGTFFENPALSSLMQTVLEHDRTLHLIGLVSDGGVHSQLTHLFALLEMARRQKLPHVCVHAILDGRDTPPDSGAEYIRKLQAHLQAKGTGVISTICGRFYAMDRDKRWERVEKAYRLYCLGEGHSETDPQKAVANAYARGESDEFVTPIAIVDAGGRPRGILKDGDGVVFFNFRADRAREITRTLTEPGFSEFNQAAMPQLSGFVCMTAYDETFDLPVAFAPVHLRNILGEVVSRRGMRQLRIAETEKYAHVTYFFNGGEERAFEGEDRCLIPSPKEVATYDLKPEMSADAVADELLKRLRGDDYDLIVLNFANMDMVGHTGVLQAAVKACEAVDDCVGRIVNEVLSMNGAVVITADHGNAEKMISDTNGPHTAHTTHPVPLMVVDDHRREALLRKGILADIAPTLLAMLGVSQPAEMTGRSLFEPE